ncbi:MAG: hypothetical protein K940chlam8_00856 [Chlamydiae bacterium]|nr:hypothetical protein [Chlamydiota bacterium]
MLKKAFLLTSIACFGFANQITYSQNNPPSQHKTDPYLAKDHPILLNANLLVGEIIGTPTNYLQVSKDDGANNITIDTFDFPKQISAGFRFGLGVNLNNVGNLSVQWTWFQMSDNDKKTFGSFAGQVVQVPLFPQGTEREESSVLNNGATTFAYQKMRYQTLDLLFQTAAWMLSSNIRFQPFGGVRFFYFKRQMCAKVLDNTNGRYGNVSSHFKLRGSGVLFGTDIKYIFSKYFFFFSNVMVGILGGYETRDLCAFTNLDPQTLPKSWKFHERFNMSFDPMYEVRLGLAFESLINNQWLLSIYVAYELASLIHTSAKSIEPSGSLDANVVNPEPAFPIRTNDVVKTQFGVLGAMVAF